MSMEEGRGEPHPTVSGQEIGRGLGFFWIVLVVPRSWNTVQEWSRAMEILSAWRKFQEDKSLVTSVSSNYGIALGMCLCSSRMEQIGVGFLQLLLFMCLCGKHDLAECALSLWLYALNM